MWAAKIVFGLVFVAAFYAVKEPIVEMHRTGIECMYSVTSAAFDPLNKALGLPPLFAEVRGDKPRTFDELVESLQQIRPLVTYKDASVFRRIRHDVL